MRTFTEISPDRLLALVPGDRLSDFAAALDRTRGANDRMQEFYESRKAAIPAA